MNTQRQANELRIIAADLKNREADIFESLTHEQKQDEAIREALTMMDDAMMGIYNAARRFEDAA